MVVTLLGVHSNGSHWSEPPFKVTTTLLGVHSNGSHFTRGFTPMVVTLQGVSLQW